MLKVYGPSRSRALRVLWICEELELPYEHVHVNLQGPERLQDEYRAIHPLSKVPAIDDEGFILWESGAILNYLAQKKPEAKLLPPEGTYNRARYDQWMFFGMSELDAALWAMAKHTFALPEPYRTEDAIPAAVFEYRRACQVLAQALVDAPFLVGHDFTAADILIGQCLMWGLTVKQSIEDSALKAYIDRLKGRPAFQRAIRGD